MKKLDIGKLVHICLFNTNLKVNTNQLADKPWDEQSDECFSCSIRSYFGVSKLLTLFFDLDVERHAYRSPKG